MPRIKLVIEYDGSNYHGFQSQDNAHTIQAELEKQLFNLCHEKISICGAGRTDAGVHARGQVVAFNTDSRIPPAKWTIALNSFLPDDIRVLSSSEVKHDFHPQFHAISKHYAYYIYRRQSAATFYRRYALLNRESFDITAMNQACRFIEGSHDFRAFCAAGSTAKTFTRTVSNCAMREQGSLLILDIKADGFLYNMVRIIAGTLIQVGKKRIEPEEIKNILESQERARAGPTAPPQGLYMLAVEYNC
ncbi:MAG: tRNA pseudouridine(38-40) synthase TruA [Syntrophomonas sp.]|nr:tRNA pseudouridine(38-40) synthase TruA [Syntrophomonas sp.]